MQSRVSARVVVRSSVECGHSVFHRNISFSCSLLSVRSLEYTLYTYSGYRRPILASLLGEDIGLGSDPPAIRACRLFLE